MVLRQSMSTRAPMGKSMGKSMKEKYPPGASSASMRAAVAGTIDRARLGARFATAPPRTEDDFETEVRRLTARLMRHFDRRHHRFLVDYGWEQVARVALRGRVFQKKRSDCTGGDGDDGRSRRP